MLAFVDLVAVRAGERVLDVTSMDASDDDLILVFLLLFLGRPLWLVGPHSSRSRWNKVFQ